MPLLQAHQEHFWYVDVGQYSLNIVPSPLGCWDGWHASIQLKEGSFSRDSKRLLTVKAAAKMAVKMMQKELAKMETKLNTIAKATDVRRRRSRRP